MENNVYVLRCNKKKFKEFTFKNDEVKNYKPKVNKIIKTMPIDGGIEDLINFIGDSLDVSMGNLQKNPTCPSCNMDLYTVSETGFFGCDDCFRTFELDLKEKFPKDYSLYKERLEKSQKISDDNKKTVIELKQKIENLISEEKFEDIVKIKNEVQRIENGESPSL